MMRIISRRMFAKCANLWFGAVAALALIVFAAYIFIAANRCSADHGIADLVDLLNKKWNGQEERQRTDNRYGGGAKPRQSKVEFAVSSLIPKEEGNQDTDSVYSKNHTWLAQFACDAKLSVARIRVAATLRGQGAASPKKTFVDQDPLRRFGWAEARVGFRMMTMT